MRSQRRRAVGWILAPGLALGLWLPGAAAAEPKTGQSPDCRRFCIKVTPREAPEGSVFTFRGRGWRPGKRVEARFGMYCRPYEACPAIGYIALLRPNAEGRFTLRLRAGEEQEGDSERRIHSGSHPSFAQRVGKPGHRRTVTRWPRYRVIVPTE